MNAHSFNNDQKSDRPSWYSPKTQALFHDAIDAMVVVDDEGECIRANNAAARLLGVSQDKLIGRSLASFFEAGFNFSEELGCLLRDRQYRGEGDLQSCEGATQHSMSKSASRPVSQRTVEYTLIGVIDSHHYLLVLRDITTRKVADQQIQSIAQTLTPPLPDLSDQKGDCQNEDCSPLEASPLSTNRLLIHRSTDPAPSPKRLFRAIFNQTFQLSSLLTPDGIVLEDNQTALDFCRLSRDEGVGQPFYDLFCWSMSLEEQTRLREAIAQAASGQTVRYEADILAPDQSVIAIDFSLKPLFNEAGKVDLLIVERQDLTDRKRVEDRLHRSEQQFRTVLDTMALVGIILDCQGRIIYCNDYLLNLTGWDREEVLYKSWFEIFLPDEIRHDLFQSMVRRATETGDFLVHYENEILTRTGDRRLIAWNNTIFCNAAGEVERITSIGYDITDQRRIEQALLEERQLFIGGPTVVFKWHVEEGWPVTYVSPNVLDQLGYPPEDLSSGRILFAHLIHPDDLERVEQEVQHYGQNGSVSFEQEYRLRHADGSYRWFHDFTVISRNDQGEVNHYAGYVQDITDRKRNEAARQRVQTALKESEERLRLALDGAHMGLWDWNLVTNRMIWSPGLERIMGLEPGQFDGRLETIESIIHPDDHEQVAEAIARAIDHDEPYNIEFRFVKSDGSVRWVMSKGSVFRDEDGHPIRMTGITIDINLRKEAQLALEQSQKRYQDLVNSVNGVVWDVDFTTLTFTFISAQAEKLLGYPCEAWLNEPSFWENHIHPDDREQTVNRCLHESQKLRDHSLDYRMIAADGRVVWVRDMVNVTTKDGKPVSLQGLLIDITTEKQRQEMLRHYERIVSATPDAVALIDSHYRYLIANQAYLDWHGRSHQEVIGCSISDLFGEDLFQHLLKPHLKEAFAGNVTRFQHWFDFPGMGQLFVSATYAPYFEESGTIIGVVVVVKDITGLKLAEMALHRQSEQEHLLAMMTYRMRRSLNLQSILDTTVAEVQSYLQADRVLVYELAADKTGVVIAESVAEGYSTLWGRIITDPCFTTDHCFTPYTQGRIQNVSDIYAASLPECYVEMLAQFQVRANLVVPILQNQHLWGLLIAQHCAEPRLWHPHEIDLLKQLTNQLAIAITQSQLYEQTVLQARHEALLNDIVAAIRNSLNLQDVLNEAVNKVLLALNVSRSIVALGSETDEFVEYTMSVAKPGVPDYRGHQVAVCNNIHLQAIFESDEPLAIDDVVQDPLFDILRDVVQDMGIQASMSVAIRAESGIKGILCVQQCDRPRLWTPAEKQLIKDVAGQLAIAIQQAELYEQVQTLNTTLELQVRDRTNELEKALEFESLLKRITDKVRDSLEENQIFETVVKELAEGLDASSCDTGIYDLDHQVSHIQHEYLRTDIPAAYGTVVRMADFESVYAQVIDGQTIQFCWLQLNNPVRVIDEYFASLVSPIVDDQRVLGDIWLYRDADRPFEDIEIHLVEQVANQCAIALRQARLYQASQAQVTELERLNHLKDDFLSTVSHELRTPMANIKMAIQMFEIYLSQAGLLEDENTPLAQYFQILQDECQRETSLINNLLDLTRLDSNTEPLMKSSIQLGLWVSHIAEVFAERARAHQQQLTVQIPDGLSIYTDLNYLERILMELLNNACKYTPPGGCITLSAHPCDHSIYLSINNTGVELPRDECDRIFDKFYRVPNGDPWKHGGTGLGLALVKKLVEKIGASIWAESSDNEVRFILEL